MLRYIWNFKRISRFMDPLPVDFGAMYYLYPEESSYMKGFRSTGLRRRILDKIQARFGGDDQTKLYRPEKIY